MIIKLHNVRLSFPDLFVPRAFKAGDPLKYKATFLVEKDSAQAKAIEDAIAAAAREAAGGKWPKTWEKTLASIRGNANRFNWQDGDTKTYAGYEGHMAFTANNLTRPLVVDRHHTKENPQILTKDDGRPYAGCYVHATVDIFAYDKPGHGISANLRGVQFVKDGEAFSGGRAASVDEFDDLGVDETDDAFA